MIVEGESDKILFSKQREWFDSLNKKVEIIPADGKQKMASKAQKYYRLAEMKGANHIIFMPDLDTDECALITRRLLKMDNMQLSITIVLKHALEAWILADRNCMRESINQSYNLSGYTDYEMHPKQKLHSLFKRHLGYNPSSVEASSKVAPYFSISRAAENNKSAMRFKLFMEGI